MRADMMGRCKVCQRAILEEEGPIFWQGSRYHEACFHSYLVREIDKFERKARHGDLTTVELEELKDFRELLKTIARSSTRRRPAAWPVRF